MDGQIEESLLYHKFVSGQKKELTPEERRKFDAVNWDRIHNQLLNLYPGDIPIVESIVVSNGKVVFFDRFSRRTEPLENLGYELINAEKGPAYRIGKTVFERGRP